MYAKPALKAEAIRLRVEERLSISKIHDRTGASRGVISLWLRAYPLTEAERSERRRAGGASTKGKANPKARHSDRRLVRPHTAFTQKPNAAFLRSSAVGIATRWFLERGYMVSVPVDQASYDLVVESDEGLKRVQVKSTTRKNRYGGWMVGIHKRIYDPNMRMNASGKRRRTPYSDTEVDLFFIVAADGSTYVVPIDRVRGKMSLVVRQDL